MKQSIMVHMSPKQIARIRNGHMVLLKKPMEGQGVNLIVDPGTYGLLSKTFSAGRGARVRLSPEEISASITGGGLASSRASKISKKIAEEVFDDPSQKSDIIVTNAGGPHAKLTPSTISGVFDQSKFFQQMNKLTGDNIGNLQRASIGNAASAMASAGYDTKMVESKDDTQVMGTGLYGKGFGTGLYASRREGGSIGRNGGFIHAVPPALQSQPYATNYQFSKTLPVSYQRFSGEF
jgi:hypothetical protein